MNTPRFFMYNVSRKPLQVYTSRLQAVACPVAELETVGVTRVTETPSVSTEIVFLSAKCVSVLNLGALQHLDCSVKRGRRL